MTHLFLDSSALIKRYFVEQGTTWINSITAQGAGNTLIIAHITKAEIVSGLMRRKREGDISPQVAHTTRLLIDHHAVREYTIVNLTEPIVLRAEDLLEQYSLRAYDSVQLASALETNERLIAAGLPPLTFVSADNRLLVVASSVGLASDDPTTHP